MTQPVVYILANKPYGTLYIGVTSNLADRIEAHRSGCVDGFTKQYGVHTLVYFDVHAGMDEAIQREKRLKKWNRAWKISLIQEMNPDGKTFRIRRSNFLNWVPAFAGKRHPRVFQSGTINSDLP